MHNKAGPADPPEESGHEHWPAALLDAVRRVQPAYFGWPAAQRLGWRLRLPPADRLALVTALLRAHGERRPATQARLEDRGRIDLVLQNRINEWLQPLKGIGEDCFSLSECFPEASSLLDFATLREYDEHEHRFQEDTRVRDFPGHVAAPYTGALYGTWARLLDGEGRLVYVTLTMLAGQLRDTMDEAAHEELDNRVPHRWVEGPEHGQRVKGGYLHDMRVDAGGQEAVYEALQKAIWAEQQRRHRELALQFAAQAGVCCYIDPHPWEHDTPDERNLRIVFSSPAALAEVRWTSFLRDCRRLERPLDELHALEAPEAARMRNFVAQRHAELMRQRLQ